MTNSLIRASRAKFDARARFFASITYSNLLTIECLSFIDLFVENVMSFSNESLELSLDLMNLSLAKSLLNSKLN